MANWRYKINLNGVLSKMNGKHDLTLVEEPCPQEVKDAIIAEIEKAPPLQLFVGRIKRATSIAAVNRALSAIFEEADYSLVWCGFEV